MDIEERFKANDDDHNLIRKMISGIETSIYKLKATIENLKADILTATSISNFMKWIVGLTVVIILALLSVIANYSRLSYKSYKEAMMEQQKDYKIITSIANTVTYIDRRVTRNEANIKQILNRKE